MESEIKTHVLVITSIPMSLDTAIEFLGRRDIVLTVVNDLREGMDHIVQNGPDWIFISVNLGSAAEKCADVLRHSFHIEPILFGDVLDRSSVLRLTQCDYQVLPSLISGPNILMKIRQNDIDPELPTPSARMLSTLKMVAQVIGDKSPFSEYRPVQVVESVNVMVLSGGEMSGYLLIASSLDEENFQMQATRFREALQGWMNTDVEIKEELFGTIRVRVDALPQWAQQRSNAICRFPSGEGEVLTCYLPDPSPMPAYQLDVATDRYELNLLDIPADTPLPCPIYMALPTNQKILCLIRESHAMSSFQRERLLKAGISNLLIQKEHLSQFSLMYVREKLFCAENGVASV